jgi:hypothetical protein
MHISRKFSILSAVLLLSIIFGVGIVQAIVELKAGEAVQVTDFLTDTFLNPLKRARVIHKTAIDLKIAIDSIGKGEPQSFSEKAMGLADELNSTAMAVNRYFREDSTREEILVIDSLRKALDTLSYELSAGSELSELASQLATARRLVEIVAANCQAVSVGDWPKLSFDAFFTHTFFSSKYIRAYEKDMEEKSVIANATRPRMQLLRYALLRDVGEKAFRGEDGWLFYKQDVEYLIRPDIRDPRSQVVDFNDSKTENAIDVIKGFKEQLKEYGVDLLVVVVPGKPSIYPDMLAKNFNVAEAGNYSHSKALIASIREAGVDCVDLFTPMMTEREKDEEVGDRLYLKTDTHWKYRGLHVAAKTVAEHIRKYPWFAEVTSSVQYTMDTVTVGRNGDVGVMTQLPNMKINELLLSFPEEPTVCHTVYKVQPSADGSSVRIPYRDDFGPDSRVLVIGDSFSRMYQTDAPRSAGWISHLAKELSQPLASIISDGGASTLVRQMLARRVAEAKRDGRRTLLDGRKLVVWEFVERDFRYGAEGWKRVDL